MSFHSGMLRAHIFGPMAVSAQLHSWLLLWFCYACGTSKKHCIQVHWPMAQQPYAWEAFASETFDLARLSVFCSGELSLGQMGHNLMAVIAVGLRADLALSGEATLASDLNGFDILDFLTSNLLGINHVL